MKVPEIIVIKGVGEILNYCSSANPELWHINIKKTVPPGKKDSEGKKKPTEEYRRNKQESKKQEATRNNILPS